MVSSRLSIYSSGINEKNVVEKSLDRYLSIHHVDPDMVVGRPSGKEEAPGGERGTNHLSTTYVQSLKPDLNKIVRHVFACRLGENR